MSLILLDGVTVDTVGAYVNSEGFQGMLRIAGTYGGGTVTIEIKGQDDSDLPITDRDGIAINTFTVPLALCTFSIPAGLQVRARLTGATAPNLFVSLD